MVLIDNFDNLIIELYEKKWMLLKKLLNIK